MAGEMVVVLTAPVRAFAIRNSWGAVYLGDMYVQEEGIAVV